MTCRGLPVMERFMRHVMPEPMSGCWLWTGSANAGGYGQFREGEKTKKAHRVSYELHNEAIPELINGSQAHVCHRCDNPSCVNPEHLFLGTHLDNMKDMYRKKRRGNDYERNSQTGVDCAWSKLTEKKVISIFHDVRSHRKIAKSYGVGKTIIGNIKTKKKWKHITEHLQSKLQKS